MFKKIKFLFLFLIILFFSFLYFRNSSVASYQKIPFSSIPADSIIDFELYSDKNFNEFVKYKYLTHDVPIQKNEIISLRTSSSLSFKKDNLIETRFYTNDPFINLNGVWKQVEYATTTLKEWNEKMAVKNFLNGLLPQIAQADSYFPNADSGVGRNNTSGTTWDALRAGAGTAATTAYNIYIYHPSSGNSYQWLFRSIWIFDTADLPDDATIDSASLNLYGLEKNDDAALSAGSLDLKIVPATPASDTSIVAGDFANVGTTPIMGSLAYGDVVIESYNSISLNSDGLSNINKTGKTKFGGRCNADLSDDDPLASSAPKDSRVTFYYSDEAGTSKDPYLSVTWSSAGGPVVASTTPGYGINHIEFIIILILFIGFFLLISKTGTILTIWLQNLWRI